MLGIWPIGIWHIRYLTNRQLAHRYLAPQPLYMATLCKKISFKTQLQPIFLGPNIDDHGTSRKDLRFEVRVIPIVN